MLELILMMLFGILFGTVTGLIPGVHINLISSMLLSVSGFLLGVFSDVGLGVFVISMSVTHTFLDSIPSIFLGAPDSDHALSVLPGHKLLLEGKGYGAVYLTIVGSFFGLVISILIFPLLVYMVSFVYQIIKNYIGFFLLLVVYFMIVREKKWYFAVLLFFFSGVLGILVLNFPNLENPLFPMLSGLFGVSGLFLSLYDNVKIPKQKFKKINLKKSVYVKNILASVFCGTLTSFMPGMGPAQGAVIGQQLSGKDERGFLVLVGGLNTVNMILSLVTVYVLGKARNGSVIAIKELIAIDVDVIVVLLGFIFFSGVLNFFWAQKLTKIFSSIILKVNYFKLVVSVIMFIFVICIFLSGPVGVLILVISSAVGLFAPLTGISRSHAMGCLLIPVITYFI